MYLMSAVAKRKNTIYMNIIITIIIKCGNGT